jgi:glycosyltransferase involved in cell wall biosynthesis
MRICVTVEQRFHRTPDGACWTPAQFPYRFWLPYTEVFESVLVIARVKDVPEVPAEWLRADGEQVELAAVPHYIGPEQYLVKILDVQRAIRAAIDPSDAVVLRVGSQLATCATAHLRRVKQPYGVEVVADPHDSFGPSSIRHPLRPFFRWRAVQNLRRQCAEASTAHYVTRTALQRRYPCQGPTWSSTDAGLQPAAYAKAPREAETFRRSIRLITVATLAQLYKGVDLLIDAVAKCLDDGIDVTLAVVGDGRHRADLESRAAKLGIANRVDFRGQLPSAEAVRDELDLADLFVLPSRAEGLPRAMIEAMARGLPCIGSTVGGIPELLPAEDLVPPDAAAALARKIAEVVTDPRRMAAMSERNLQTSREYGADIAKAQHIAFLRCLRDLTEQRQMRSSHLRQIVS